MRCRWVRRDGASRTASGEALKLSQDALVETGGGRDYPFAVGLLTNELLRKLLETDHPTVKMRAFRSNRR